MIIKILLYCRESTLNKQKQKFKIDISEFLKTGNRKDLTKILPNDIIIIKQNLFL